MNTSMSPLYVEILLHQYVWHSDPGHVPYLPDGMELHPAQKDDLADMQFHGLLQSYFRGYTLTDKGLALVENILNTPMPVEDVRWIDPRFKK